MNYVDINGTKYFLNILLLTTKKKSLTLFLSFNFVNLVEREKIRRIHTNFDATYKIYKT